jgi:hypothetical protein
MEEAVHEPGVCSPQGGPQRNEDTRVEIASELHAEAHDLGVEYVLRWRQLVVFDDAGIIQGYRRSPTAEDWIAERSEVEPAAGAADRIDGSDLGETLAEAATGRSQCKRQPDPWRDEPAEAEHDKKINLLLTTLSGRP